jgi:hypothetical protein
MITFAYDRYDLKRRTVYPNLWNKLLCDYADTLDTDDIIHTVRARYNLSTNHSELKGRFINQQKYKFVVLKDMDTKSYDGEKLFYPIEIFGSHSYLVQLEDKTNDGGETYNTAFINVVSEESVKLAKRKKLVYVINISHEPFSDIKFLYEFSSQIKQIGLNENNFIIFGGSSNLLELYPELKNIGFNFCFEDNLLISSCKKIEDLKRESNTILKYKSEYIKESEILEKRTKYFVCPNRNSNKEHRFTLGCFFESKNLWDKIYSSFLFKAFNTHILRNLNSELNDSLTTALDSFIKKLPIQMDTQLLSESEIESFESMRAFKKEIYLDSYIHIVTETNFKNDIFPTEKIINPMVVLQPFILVGAPGYLKYIKSLGFKTFDGFIDETYDDEYSDAKRFELICNEIDRLSKLSLEEIHNWYISIIPILEYNRNFAIEFAKKPMFINNLKKHEYYAI